MIGTERRAVIDTDTEASNSLETTKPVQCYPFDSNPEAQMLNQDGMIDSIKAVERSRIEG